MQQIQPLVITVLLMLCVEPAMAHEKGAHKRVMGTVRSMGPDKIVVQTAHGHDQAILLDQHTECGDDDADATCAAIKKGDRVVITTRGSGAKLIADEIRFSSRKKLSED
jgi:hypothetical protein